MKHMPNPKPPLEPLVLMQSAAASYAVPCKSLVAADITVGRGLSFKRRLEWEMSSCSKFTVKTWSRPKSVSKKDPLPSTVTLMVAWLLHESKMAQNHGAFLLLESSVLSRPKITRFPWPGSWHEKAALTRSIMSCEPRLPSVEAALAWMLALLQVSKSHFVKA